MLKSNIFHNRILNMPRNINKLNSKNDKAGQGGESHEAVSISDRETGQ